MLHDAQNLSHLSDAHAELEKSYNELMDESAGQKSELEWSVIFAMDLCSQNVTANLNNHCWRCQWLLDPSMTF